MHGIRQNFKQKDMSRAHVTATNTAAIAWVVAGTALFSLIYASGKFAEAGVSAIQILCLRYVGGFLTLLLVVACGGGSVSSLRSRRPLSHLARAVFGASGGAALIYASANMPIMDATALGLLYVVFVIPLGVFVLRERVTRRHLVAIAVCCGGAAIVMGSRGAFTQFQPAYLLPAGVATLGALLLALEGLLIKTLAQSDRALTVLLHVNAFGAVLMALPAVLLWGDVSGVGLLGMLLLGPIAVTAQYCIVRGYRMAPLSVVGPVDYSWLIFAGLIGVLFFDEHLTAGVVAGSLAIAAGGILLAITRSPETHG